MNSEELAQQVQRLVSQGDALKVQLWVAMGVISVGGLFLGALMKSMWDDQKKALADHGQLLAIHDKEIAVLKSRHDISDAIKDGMAGISDAITDKNRTLQTLAERRRGQ